MDTLLILGIILGAGFILGELVRRLGLPRVTGYILAGVVLNPGTFHLIPIEFVQSTDPVVHVALVLLTFSVGGTLSFAPLRELGRGILFIVLGEAELAALAVFLGMLATLPFLLHLEGATFLATFVPMALMLGSLACPTDPSATLAVMHEYKAKGPVSFSIMATAAFDDALGIVNFSIAVALAAIFTRHVGVQPASLVEPVIEIGGAILLGILLGLVFYGISRLIHAEPAGLHIVVILAVLTLCYGLATLLNLDQLLATMTVGATAVNFGRRRSQIFRLIEDYLEPVVFVLFFTLSGMYLDFQILLKFLPVVLLFVAFRSLGKLTGAYAGAALARASRSIRRYTGWGLIPQGGIVIGLALILRQKPALANISDIMVSIIIGATVIHELIGPLTAKLALRQAGELHSDEEKSST